MADSEGHPERDEIGIGPVLSALADPLRRRVVAELARSPEGTERTCASFGLPVTKATLTHHFRVLREAGLIRQINRGNSRTAALRRDDIDAKLPGLLSLVVANDIVPDSCHGISADEKRRNRAPRSKRKSRMERDSTVPESPIPAGP